MKRSRHEASTLRLRESPQSEMKLKLGTSSERVLAIALWVGGGRGDMSESIVGVWSGAYQYAYGCYAGR